MEPTAFNEENLVLGKSESMTADQCDPLSVYVDPDRSFVLSCWKLTVEELEEINRTGKVWLFVVGATMPPVVLQVASPFPK